MSFSRPRTANPTDNELRSSEHEPRSGEDSGGEWNGLTMAQPDLFEISGSARSILPLESATKSIYLFIYSNIHFCNSGTRLPGGAFKTKSTKKKKKIKYLKNIYKVKKQQFILKGLTPLRHKRDVLILTNRRESRARPYTPIRYQTQINEIAQNIIWDHIDLRYYTNAK